MYISDCKSALLPFKKCTTVTISKPINRKECRYQNHLNHYHLVFLFLVQIPELFEFSWDLKCRNCLSMLQLCHFYRTSWQPKESQSLDYVHEENNTYFAIKVMDQDKGLLLDTCRWRTLELQEYLLDRGARIVSILNSAKYCVSSVVQGGLEIPCWVEMYMSPTVKQRVDWYIPKQCWPTLLRGRNI